MSDIYLSLTETPTVVTLSQPVVSGALAATVTVGNTVTVALDANSLSALENVTVTVGAAVSISNFPATQVVTGSVAVTTMPALSISSVSISNFPGTVTVGNSVTIGNFPAVQDVAINGNPAVYLIDDEQNPLGFGQNPVLVSVNGTASVTIKDPSNLSITSTAAAGSKRGIDANLISSVTIGSLPAISGTVTANLSSVPTHGVTIANSSVTVNGTFYQATQPVSLASLPSLAAGTAQIGSVTASISGTVPVSISSVTISNFPATQTVTASNLSAVLDEWEINAQNKVFSVVAQIAGQGYVNNSSKAYITNSVTIGSLPRVTLIDGSGSVATANSAIQVFATTTTRSYLLVQVTTGSAYVNVGATATTANGIYLASGQGYAWETTIPQGVCSLISTVTGTAYCAKQA